jgi:uncharacterized integral membrane protein
MRWFVFLPLAVLVVLFALSNPQTIELRLWPFDLAVSTSAAIAVMSIAACAFFIGALVAWFAALPARRRGWVAQRRVAELEARLETLTTREAADTSAKKALQAA